MNPQNDTACVSIRLAELHEASEIAKILAEAFEEYRALYTEEAFSVKNSQQTDPKLTPEGGSRGESQRATDSQALEGAGVEETSSGRT